MMQGFFGFIKRLWRGKLAQAEKSTTSPREVGDSLEAFQKPSEKNINSSKEIKEKRKGPTESKYIAVVGLTGSGLSQFIHDVTGAYEEGVAPNTSITQGTTKITPVEAWIGERHVTLIDTPGFVYSPGGGRTQSGTFNDLVSWVKDKKARRLDGVIYMHDIQNRGICRSRFVPPPDLVDLCGYSKIIFVTSRWDELGSRREGEDREGNFREGYWGFMIKNGSSMRRYECPGGGRAKEILESLW